MSFNLLDERWIPILRTDGRAERIGIREALTNAGNIRQIAASNPMDNVALLRFLLAVLYWCKGNPPHDGNAISNDPFSVGSFSTLDANRDYFNLLGDGKRFYQDRAARRARPVTDLIQEIPTGNNFWHFRHSTDYSDGLCPACCTMGLLRLPLFSVSGLPNLKAGINGTPPAYVVPLGRSLLGTLFANWSPFELLGDPAWVQPDICPTPGQDVSLLTGLTLLSRRVWLHEPSEPPGLCMGCGARETALIRTCEFQTAGQQKNDRWHDPHVVYVDGKPRRALKAADLTTAGKFRMDRPWADLLVRMLETGKIGRADKPTSLLFVGFATDQAKNIDVWQRILCVPCAGSIQGTVEALIQRWQKEGTQLEKRKVWRSKAEGKAAIVAIRPHVEHRVSAKTRGLIPGTDEAWNRAAAEYHPMMEMIAKSLSPGYTTAALLRRREIANVLPDMRPKPQAPKKPGKKKGEDK